MKMLFELRMSTNIAEADSKKKKIQYGEERIDFTAKNLKIFFDKMENVINTIPSTSKLDFYITDNTITKDISKKIRDVVIGKNVDIVMPSEYEIPLESAKYDIVISGNCLEHVKNPFRLVKEMTRLLKKDGFIFILAPFQCAIHRYPIDTFRYCPDGFTSILEESGIKVLETYLGQNPTGIIDCVGAGKKC